MKEYGFVRITAVTPKVAIADVDANFQEHLNVIQADNFTQIDGSYIEGGEPGAESDVIVFPELSLTGYTCEDLFFQKTLQNKVLDALYKLASMSSHWRSTVIVGCPIYLREDNTLRNCAVIIGGGKIQGIIPKTYLPNYNEFYEARWFAGAQEKDPKEINIGLPEKVPFGTDLLFAPDYCAQLKFGVEICEDVWSPIPPSSYQALAGATVLFNLSASNEVIGKADYRRNFVKSQSGKLSAAYIYCSSGPTESTKDLVFGGHNIIGESGNIVSEGRKFVRETHSITYDVDVEKLGHERSKMPGTFAECHTRNQKEFHTISYMTNPLVNKNTDLYRSVNAHPFVPKNHHELDDRCGEIFGIQTCGLAKRLEQVSKGVVIGVSGGLDSTLALLVACKTFDMLGEPRSNITGITMPGFGTTTRTLNNAKRLMLNLEVSQKTIDIREACVQMWKDMEHCPFGSVELQSGQTVEEYIHELACSDDPDEFENFNQYESHMLTVERLEDALEQLPPKAQDLVFENVQARIRTTLLMSHGFVLGTGDLSEMALGWCTYNGDHMSMYNVNCSIPKTLVKFLVEYIAEHEVDKTWVNRNNTYHCLLDIVKTPISPELLPTQNGEITQVTEDHIGPYELHDFFLAAVVRNGYTPSKILFLAQYAEFDKEYTLEELGKWLKMFYKRFFGQQFKRDCVPDGPKVGTVSLSPRGDWRMPTEAQSTAWLAEVDLFLEIHKEQ